MMNYQMPEPFCIELDIKPRFLRMTWGLAGLAQQHYKLVATKSSSFVARSAVREMKIHAEQYDAVLSLLFLPRLTDVWPLW